ncbi:MAG: aminotransferase class I/II-fold pyridoxal phosphate-dependent enzyme, partial [Bacteroidota bacterium]|nr:aminotransferase class I/II-fold pyridoxal phosphate-dependent enzyme [Bacteroidota bacterium]
MRKDKLHFNSKTIHGGQQPDKGYRAVMPPVYLTSTYAQSSPGDHHGYEYSRTHNPTRTALEASLASIENGKHGFCFGSGMAAIDAVVKLLSPGDEVISTNDLYGGSYRIFTKIFQDLGIVFHFVDMQDPANVAAKINVKTKLIWVETPTNPMMNVVDITAMSQLVEDRDIYLAVDNTFAS